MERLRFALEECPVWIYGDPDGTWVEFDTEVALSLSLDQIGKLFAAMSAVDHNQQDELGGARSWDAGLSPVEIHDETLEEAARLVERYCDSPMAVQVAGEAAAKAIRALKSDDR